MAGAARASRLGARGAAEEEAERGEHGAGADAQAGAIPSIGGSFGIESSLRSARVARSAFASPSGAPFVATQPRTIAPSDATSFGSSGAPAGDAVVASASSAGAVAAKLRRFIMLSSFFDLRSLTSLSIRFLRHSSLSRPPFGLRRSEVSRPMALAAVFGCSEKSARGRIGA